MVGMTENQEREVEVGLERSVRFGRIIIGGAVLGAIVALILTLLFEVPEGALYELRQIAGFMIVIGAALGLGLGAVVSLVLHFIVRNKRGSGVAIQRDVQ